jgi:CHAT domain-containing protein/tetratricopeptide (TPR) repeat protein
MVRTVRASLLVLFFSAIFGQSLLAQATDELNAQARQAYSAGDYKTAARLARMVYDATLKSQPPDSFELATAALNLGKSLVKADDPEEGVTYVKEACDIAQSRFGEKDARVGSCLMELIEAEIGSHSYADAGKTAEGALAIIKQVYPTDGYAAAVFHAGELFRTPTTLDTAAKYFELAAHIYGTDQLNEQQYLDASLSELGEVEYEQQAFKQAAAHLQKVYELESQGSSTLSANGISKIYMLADCYSRIGAYEDAISLLGKVAASLEGVNVPGHISANEILLQIAELERANGGSSESLETYRKILTKLEGHSDATSQSYRTEALYESAEVYDRQHDVPSAESYFRKAVAVTNNKTEDGDYHVEALQELGMYLLRHGRYAEARVHLDDALATVSKSGGNDSLEAAGLLTRMAVGLISENDCESALPLITHATAIYTAKTPDGRDYVETLKMSASCTTDSTQRAALTRKALDLQFRIGHQIDAGLAREEGQEYYRLGKLDLAEKTAILALSLDSKDLEAHDLLSDIYDDQNRMKEAIAMEQHALKMAAENYGEDSTVVAARAFNLGKLLLRSGDSGTALTSFESAANSFNAHVQQSLALLSLGEQRQLLIGQATAQTSGLLSACQTGTCLNSAYDLLLPWKGLLIDGLARQSRLIKAATSSSDAGTIAKWKTALTQLAQWSASRGTVPYDEWKTTDDRLLREKEEYERALLASSDLSTLNMEVSIASLRKVLMKNEVFVDIYRYDQFGKGKGWLGKYCAVITGSSVGPVFVPIGDAGAVESAVQQWRSSLDSTSNADWLKLVSVVWVPVRQALPKETAVVRVSSDGILSRFPWHEVVANPEELAANLQVTEVESARVLLNLRADSRSSDKEPENLLLVGDLDYDAGRIPSTPGKLGQPFKELKWATREASSIQNTAKEDGVEVVWMQRASATKAAVLKNMEGKQYLHFATHGFAADREIDLVMGRSWEVSSGDKPSRDPLVDSGLALPGANVTDRVTLETAGILTAEELLSTDLRSSKLVVLSACATGLGTDTAGQGLEGLRSAFLASGARGLIMSLWNVDDEATGLLMTEFYKQLLDEKSTVVESLHRAQQKVRSDPRFGAPRYWAGWVVVSAD